MGLKPSCSLLLLLIHPSSEPVSPFPTPPPPAPPDTSPGVRSTFKAVLGGGGPGSRERDPPHPHCLRPAILWRERHLHDRGAEEILQRHEEAWLQEAPEAHSPTSGIRLWPLPQWPVPGCRLRGGDSRCPRSLCSAPRSRTQPHKALLTNTADVSRLLLLITPHLAPHDFPVPTTSETSGL